MAAMTVTFYKQTEKRLSYWEAVRGKRTRVPGSAMALGRGGMPHDPVSYTHLTLPTTPYV